jgi:transcriptional regulator with XRE-family HTH domain
MTPLGLALESFRRSRGLQQNSLALSAGIRPCYLSAIEKGKKGPPSNSVLQKLIETMDLSEDEARELETAAYQSRQRLTVPDQASIHEYRLLHKIWEKLGSLSENQVKGMELFLEMQDQQASTYKRKHDLTTPKPKA